MAKGHEVAGAGDGTSGTLTAVHQFLIVLSGVDPLVWRRIQVPLSYSFWDLHVAIQDAMGWLDCHLHEFRVVSASGHRVVSIGIPAEDEPAGHPVEPGWLVPLADFFGDRRWDAPPALYLYDFGDDWQHALVHEGLHPLDAGREYPCCVGGAQRCPPEDSGGVEGYAHVLEVIADRSHPEYDDVRAWLGAPFDPAVFDPTSVRFSDPARRWKKAFS